MRKRYTVPTVVIILRRAFIISYLYTYCTDIINFLLSKFEAVGFLNGTFAHHCIFEVVEILTKVRCHVNSTPNESLLTVNAGALGGKACIKLMSWYEAFHSWNSRSRIFLILILSIYLPGVRDSPPLQILGHLK